MFPAQDLPQKFAEFFTNKIVLIRQKLDSAAVPPSPSPVSDTVYNGPTLWF